MRGTLETKSKREANERTTRISATYRRLLIQEVSRRIPRGPDDPTPKVGMITYKGLLDDARTALVEAGIDPKRIEADYYWNVRGSNLFTDCDFIIILGYPFPNPQGLYEEACVLYDGDMPPITDEPEYFALDMRLRGGQTFTIQNIRGYKDNRLQALYRQKSVSELYQAFHRARPYGPATSVKEVLLFTDVPVEGVPVDGFFGVGRTTGRSGRHGRAFDTLSGLLDEHGGEVAVPQLVDAIMSTFPEEETSRTAVYGWVRREASVRWLTRSTGAEYVPG